MGSASYVKNTLEHSHRSRHLEGGMTRINRDIWFTGRSWTLHCWGQPLSLGTSSPTAHYWLKDSGVPWQKPLGRDVPGLPRQENGQHSSWESERGAAYLATEHVVPCMFFVFLWYLGDVFWSQAPERLGIDSGIILQGGLNHDRMILVLQVTGELLPPVGGTHAWLGPNVDDWKVNWKWLKVDWIFQVLMANWIWHGFL